MEETELPEFIDQDVLRDVKDVNVPDEALLKCFVKVNKPFLSASAVADMTGLSDEGTRQRLNSLAERGQLRSEEAGKQTKVYWLNDPRSRWPVPGDLADNDTALQPGVAATMTRINSLTTVVLVVSSALLSMVILDWISDYPATDGIIEVTLNWDILSLLAIILLGVVFYVALQTSLHVENDDAGWPTIRRVYRRVTG